MPDAAPDLSQVRLHVVTGKGGTGKTTVAAAVALALTRQGKRVLLAEVEGRQGISQTFDVAPLGHREQRILHDRTGGELWAISVDAKESLLEYLQKFYKAGRAGSVLEKFGAIDFATTIAPGVRDVLLIGKVYEAAGRRAGKGASQPVYDAVVLDAPPTGRVVRFLNVNAEVADVARVGPIRSQADSITRMLRSHTTAVHVVTLLEEMPVQETVDAVAELRSVGLPVGAIVVNSLREPLLTDAALRSVRAKRPARLAEAVAADLASVGLTAPKVVEGLLVDARDHAARVALEREQDAILTAQDRLTVRLPLLPEGTDGGGIAVLAGSLAAQGMV